MSRYRLLRRIRDYVRRLEFRHRDNAFVSDPGLIHPSAKITNSTLIGRVVVGKNSIIKNCIVTANDLVIGRNTSLWGPNISVHCALNPVTIGSFCSIARNVSIQEYNHRTDRISTYFFSCNVFNETMETDVVSSGPISIGNDVWIASNAVIASGVTIGDGAVIGANSVVLGDVPPYAVAVGAPARVVRYRFSDEMIASLLRLKWWEWGDEKIGSNRRLFLSPLSQEILDGIK